VKFISGQATAVTPSLRPCDWPSAFPYIEYTSPSFAPQPPPSSLRCHLLPTCICDKLTACPAQSGVEKAKRRRPGPFQVYAVKNIKAYSGSTDVLFSLGPTCSSSPLFHSACFSRSSAHHLPSSTPMSAQPLEPSWPDTDLSAVSGLEFDFSDWQSLFTDTLDNFGHAESQENPDWLLGQHSRQSICSRY
jgi:hypothetical protein